MSRYIANRLAEIVVVTALMSFVVYLLIGLMPGDPIEMMISGDPKMTSEDAARLRAVYGLDRPLVERYLAWAAQAVQGNFGYSGSFGQPVIKVLGPRLLNTLQLAGISTPPFWLALLLITLFSVKLGVLPAGGMADVRPGTPWLEELGQKVRFAVLPIGTLLLLEIGRYTRFMRGAMIEVLRQDYVRTARAKGASQGRVLWRHAFGNALAPVLTILGLSFGGLFSGALITETMFAWPGMGRMIYQAILDNDYNLALVGLLIITVATIVGNLLADIALVAVDPRVSLESRLR
jgi:peptide/nickel transport system permease protein